MHEEGSYNVKKDISLAKSYYIASSEQGATEPLYRLGCLYEKEEGMEDKAEESFEKAASSKCYKSQYKLGMIFLTKSEDPDIDRRHKLIFFNASLKDFPSR